MTVRFVELNPENDEDWTELLRQRVLCGWGDVDVPHWRESARNGDIHFFWFAPLEDDPAIPLINGIPILGHFCLEWKVSFETEDPDYEVANKDERMMYFGSLYVLQPGKGLGSAVMSGVETLARDKFDVKTLTLTVIPKKSASTSSFWIDRGYTDVSADPFRGALESWYLRKGFVGYKEVMIRPDLPLGIPLICMRKSL